MSEGQVNRADLALRETRRIKSDDPQVLDLVGTTLTQMGEYDLAKVFFTRANQLRPNYPPFMMNLANNLVYHGDKENSENIFRAVLQIQPDGAQVHWSLATAKKAKDRQHIKKMEKLCEKFRNNPRALAFLYYAIGKESEDLEHWDRAIKAFNRGAAARRETIEYDEQAEIAFFDYLQEHYTSEWLADGDQGVDDRSPIFVLGQPRTGTTLIERIITLSLIHI